MKCITWGQDRGNLHRSFINLCWEFVFQTKKLPLNYLLWTTAHLSQSFWFKVSPAVWWPFQVSVLQPQTPADNGNPSEISTLPVGGEAEAYITHSSKCICKHLMCVSLFSLWCLACGPSGDPSLRRSICSCLLHRKSRNVLQSARLCTSLLILLYLSGLYTDLH